MWLLIVPIVIVLVIVLGLTSVIGALGANWPWLLIGLGAWMFWRGDGRHRRSRRDERRAHDRHGWESSAPSASSASSATSTEPAFAGVCGGRSGRDRPDRQARHAKSSEPTPIQSVRKAELPIDVQVKVEQIRRKVEVLLGFADRFPPFSKDLFLVRQTASEYLPRTINAYLALPAQAADRPLAATGQTPHQELKAQLDLLDAKLDEIAQDLQSQDVDRLLANRRFLEERFGKATA
jgi:hypothetical protein